MTVQMPARSLKAITKAEGDMVGAAIAMLQYVDPSNPYANPEYTIKEFRRLTMEAFPGHTENTIMSNDDVRRDMIFTCEFVIKILKS